MRFRLLLFLLLAACARAGGDGYRPRVGDLMLRLQLRHMKLALAGGAGNWALTAYELEELQETLKDIQTFHPLHPKSGAPLGRMVPAMMGGPVEALRRAVRAKDREAFRAAFAGLTKACTACHVNTGFPFVVIRQPAGNPFPNQDFAPVAEEGGR